MEKDTATDRRLDRAIASVDAFLRERPGWTRSEEQDEHGAANDWLYGGGGAGLAVRVRVDAAIEVAAELEHERTYTWITAQPAAAFFLVRLLEGKVEAWERGTSHRPLDPLLGWRRPWGHLTAMWRPREVSLGGGPYAKAILSPLGASVGGDA